MEEIFDLRDSPWIPVKIAGIPQFIGLREMFHRAHEIDDLELPVPPAASGLMRILAAITARIVSISGIALDDAHLAEEPEKWIEFRNRFLREGRFSPDSVETYFNNYVPKGRFDLFDPERPFLQDPRLRTECVDARGVPNPSGVNKVVLGRPTGVNGAVMFGHFTDADPVPVPAGEAVWWLIAQLYYGPSGQCTPRRITDHKPGNGDAGPLRKSVSFHPWGPDLFHTLVLSVPAPVDVDDPDVADLCPWERDRLPSPLAPLDPVTWPGGLLTGRARHAVLLEPSADGTEVVDAYVTWSTHEPAPTVADPYVVLDMPRSGDGGPFARPADGHRAIWRDLDALLLKGNGQSQRPAILEDLPRELRSQLRVRAYGFDQDGQQRDNGWYEASTPPVLAWQEEAGEEAAAMASHIGRCHEAAEEVGERLSFAARLAWKLTTDAGADPTAKIKLDRKKPGPWEAKALARYWPAAEHVFWQLATPEHCDKPAHRPFVEAALDALDDTLGAARADIRAARARSRARSTLRALLASRD